MTRVAIAHDYLTQRGGAERVVLAMTRAFPEAPVYTALYNASTTFPEFRAVEIHSTWLDRIPLLRHRHRLALPLLAPAFEHAAVDADVVLCSSSGWSHGIAAGGRKIVYCHTPARWLYDGTRYLAGRKGAGWAALAALRPYLLRWDRRAALTANRYLANSTVTQRRIRDTYGIPAEVLPAPPGMRASAEQRVVEGVEPGFFLCVSRLLPYKNVDAVVTAFAELGGARLVVVGVGPEAARLRALASPRVQLAGNVSDAELRWLYANCRAVVAASYEDYGLTPLEAAVFGRPSVTLRGGGFLDTVVEGTTGLFFDRPLPSEIRRAVTAVAAREWDKSQLQAHADSFSEERFAERLRAEVEREAVLC
jgi:glycosyltransferase involved in cell wall biosynthesis